jgi:hypothetical protein
MAAVGLLFRKRRQNMHGIKRDFFDRRSGKDRRRKIKLDFLSKGSEKRLSNQQIKGDEL